MMITKEEMIKMISEQIEFEKEMFEKTKKDYWQRVMKEHLETIENIKEE